MTILSKDTLLAVEQNSVKLRHLDVGTYSSSYGNGLFNSTDSEDYDRLGTAIGNNSSLRQLRIDNLSNNITLKPTNKKFYDRH